MNLRLSPAARDVILLVLGALGLGHETLIADGERPTLVVAFIAMMGLPGILHVEDPRKKAEKKSEEDPP